LKTEIDSSSFLADVEGAGPPNGIGSICDLSSSQTYLKSAASSEMYMLKGGGGCGATYKTNNSFEDSHPNIVIATNPTEPDEEVGSFNINVTKSGKTQEIMDARMP
jgi:hypothetical protein